MDPHVGAGLDQWPRHKGGQQWERSGIFVFKNLNVCPALYLTHISSQHLCTLVTVLRDWCTFPVASKQAYNFIWEGGFSESQYAQSGNTPRRLRNHGLDVTELRRSMAAGEDRRSITWINVRRKPGPQNKLGAVLAKKKKQWYVYRGGAWGAQHYGWVQREGQKYAAFLPHWLHFPLPCKRHQQVLMCHHELQMPSKNVWTRPKRVSEAHAASEFREPANDNTDSLSPAENMWTTTKTQGRNLSSHWARS